MTDIKSIKHQQVLAITIDRPDKKNALTLEMYRQMSEMLMSATDDPTVRVVTICGGDNCFSAGNDLHDFVGAGLLDDDHPVVHFLQVLAAFNKPIIAGVAGFAIGIGTTLLMHCDLVYAAPDAVFQLPFAQLGLCPEAASSLILPGLMGYHRAAELLMFGEQIDAKTALNNGMINKVISEQPITEYIAQRAAQLAAMPFESIVQTKRLLKSNHLAVMSAMDEEITEFGRLLHSDDCQNIIRALLKPRFSS